MSLEEAGPDLRQAKNWTPEQLIKGIQEKTKNAVVEFLSAKGDITFSFEDLIKYIGDTLTVGQDEETILRAMTCLFMRLDIESKDRKKQISIYVLYRKGLDKLGIKRPESQIGNGGENTANNRNWWSGWKIWEKKAA